MPKRLLFVLGIVAVILAACKAASTSTSPTPTPSPTVAPGVTTTTVTATYFNTPLPSQTIYMNAAPAGCATSGSTAITGSTITETTNSSGEAIFTNLTPDDSYTWFYIYSASGPTVSVCTEFWDSGITLSYP